MKKARKNKRNCHSLPPTIFFLLVPRKSNTRRERRGKECREANGQKSRGRQEQWRVEKDETGQPFDATSSPALTCAIQSLAHGGRERVQEGSLCKEGKPEATMRETNREGKRERKNERENDRKTHGTVRRELCRVYRGTSFCTPHIFYD